jgi:hypothetical protein
MNDFETRLANRMADLVDHEAGAPESAPPFLPVLDQGTPDRRRPVAWLLVAAAVVLVAAMGVAGFLQFGKAAGPQVAGPPTPTSEPSTSPAGVVPTVVGGMTLSLPAGWVVTSKTYTTGNGPMPGSTVWCIDPVTAKGSCTISLTSAGASSNLDVDIEGGYLSNPEYCFGDPTYVKTNHTLDAADVRLFGGRSAEYRAWTHTCTNPATVIHVEMYEVAYAPAWILYSELADTYVSAVMNWVAQHSVLPAQTRPLRLQDLGYLRSVKTVGTNYVIALDRVYSNPSSTAGEINNASTTYEYAIPVSLTDVNGTKIAAPTVGDRVLIATNGFSVTSYQTQPL